MSEMSYGTSTEWFCYIHSLQSPLHLGEEYATVTSGSVSLSL
jgi:hypothetical protein